MTRTAKTFVRGEATNCRWSGCESPAARGHICIYCDFHCNRYHERTPIPPHPQEERDEVKRVDIDLCTCAEHGGLEPDGSHRQGCSWYDPARPARLVEVDNCAGCPFYRWPTMLCTLTDRARQVGDASAALAAPPDWCPLRKQDHLVTLRVK